jgi:hypothetical protein
LKRLLPSTSASVKCSQKEEVGIDDPAFANMDPHLKVDESDDEEFHSELSKRG